MPDQIKWACGSHIAANAREQNIKNIAKASHDATALKHWLFFGEMTCKFHVRPQYGNSYYRLLAAMPCESSICSKAWRDKTARIQIIAGGKFQDDFSGFLAEPPHRYSVAARCYLKDGTTSPFSGFGIS
ncbi:MAG: hypothetical protein ABI963_14735 [Rhizomicrobium sp.]